MLIVTYKSGEVKEVSEPFSVKKEEMCLIESIKKKDTYKDYIKNCFQSFIHSANHLSRNSVESPFTNISITDRTKLLGMIDDDNMGWYFQEEDADHGIPQDALDDWKNNYPNLSWKEYVVELIIKAQELFMDVMDNGDPLHDHAPITFPVTTLNISRGPKDESGSYTVQDKQFLEDFCNKHDIYRYNIYVSEGNKIASCCRLINDYDLFTLGGQVNSFGGTALSLGSHRVCTINMRRIALECDSFEDYKNKLRERMESAAKILIAHRSLIQDLTQRGVQPFAESGWLPLDKMFSTFGILGYVEAAQDLENRFGEDKSKYLDEMVDFIEANSRRLTKETHNIFNVEQIPGETMAVKLANMDRLLYGEDKVSEKIYANQFVPLWEKTTLKEKFEREGDLAARLSGGGIIHYSIGEKLTKKQAKYAIEMALKSGVEHFALNPTFSICENDHYTFGKHDICPKCSAKIVDNLSRTVGFYIRTSNMTKTKREEDFEKRHYDKFED